MKKKVKLSLQLDIERPYGGLAATEEGRQLRRQVIAFDRLLIKTLDGLKVPRTLFFIGQYLEGCLGDYSAKQLKEAYDTRDSLSEVQSHTFFHFGLVKPLEGEDKPIVSAAEFRRDLVRANDIIKQIFGVTPFGLSMPYGYEGDLCDVPEILKVLSELDFKYVLSDARKGSSLYTELTLERQPHTYKAAGFSNLVEIPTHGNQDVILTWEKALRFLGRKPDNQSEIKDYYERLLGQALSLGNQSKQPIYLCLALHPWAIMEYDPGLEILQWLIKSAKEKGIEFVSFRQIAEEILAR